MKLTKATASRIAVPEGRSEILVFDESLPGFGLRVRLGGKRTWIAQYRLGEKQRRLTLGTMDAVDADEARKRARSALAKAQLGVDPQLEKQDARNQAAITFRVVRDKYLAKVKDQLGTRTYEESERHLTRHWAPFSELPLAQIRRSTVADRINEIAKEKGLYAANRARASLSAFFSWAIGEGQAEVNPVAGTNKAIEEKARNHVLTDQELSLVWRASNDDDYGNIIRLLILTAQRREEIGGLLWSELNVAGALWTIGDTRTKNRLAHDVPLSASALQIISARGRQDGRDFVFGSRSGPFQGWSNSKVAIDERIRLLNGGKAIRPWRLHDLRRTTATKLGDFGVLPHVVEATLNHISGFRAGVAGIYNRAAYAMEKRQALDQWAERVALLVSGG